MRSHILMMSPLPTVEAACGSKEEHDVLAMAGRKQDLKCHNCGKTGHNQDTCWACKEKRGTKNKREVKILKVKEMLLQQSISKARN
ncbi:Gag-Pol polyprotein [Bienertia sinuspersici]